MGPGRRRGGALDRQRQGPRGAAMTSGMLQSTVFGDLFGTAAMRDVFGEAALFRNCAVVEAALARAQARLGIIPEEAAAAISRVADAIVSGREPLDFERLKC